MRLLLDAQLPRRLSRELTAAGHDAVHTLDLPDGNRTTDAEIVRQATSEARIVVTKDADFVASFWLQRQPPLLLLVSTGNIGNDALVALFATHLAAIESAFGGHAFVEYQPHRPDDPRLSELCSDYSACCIAKVAAASAATSPCRAQSIRLSIVGPDLASAPPPPQAQRAALLLRKSSKSKDPPG